MKRLITALLLVLATGSQPVFPADTTAALLTADVAGDRLYIFFEGKELSYKLSPTGAPQVLADNTTILIRASTGVAYVSFNPLTTKVKIEVTEQPDANYDISSFLTALTGFAKAVVPPPTTVATAGGEKAAPLPCVFDALATARDNVDAVLESKPGAEDVEKWKALSSEEVSGWREQALGLKGVTAVEKAIGQASKRLDARLSEISTRWKQLQSEWQAVTARAIGGPPYPASACLQKGAQTLAAVASQAPKVEAAIADTTSIRDSLSKLSDYLKTFIAPFHWSGDDYTFPVKRAAIGKQATVKITVTSQDLVLGKTSVAVQDIPKEQITRALILREYSLFPLEVGVAVLHSDLRYPKYGTAMVNGKTVVAKADNSTNTVTGAVMLNALCRCMGRSSPVFPGLQIGVGTAKDAPSLLAGFVLRFISPSSLSIMAGRQVTWAKDLDKLKLGDAVTGTAAIDADLKLRRLPSVWYIGAQYSFGK